MIKYYNIKCKALIDINSDIHIFKNDHSFKSQLFKKPIHILIYKIYIFNTKNKIKNVLKTISPIRASPRNISWIWCRNLNSKRITRNIHIYILNREDNLYYVRCFTVILRSRADVRQTVNLCTFCRDWLPWWEIVQQECVIRSRMRRRSLRNDNSRLITTSGDTTIYRVAWCDRNHGKILSSLRFLTLSAQARKVNRSECKLFYDTRDRYSNESKTCAM